MLSTRSRSNSSASVEWIVLLSAVNKSAGTRRTCQLLADRIIQLPDLPLSSDKDNWMPLKDCWRQILLTEPEKIEFSNFTVHVVKIKEDPRRRCASCAFKAKRAAEKIFRRKLLEMSVQVLLIDLQGQLLAGPGLGRGCKSNFWNSALNIVRNYWIQSIRRTQINYLPLRSLIL